MKINFNRNHIGTLAVMVLIAIFGRDVVLGALNFAASGI
jgi:hypothetical protein